MNKHLHQALSEAGLLEYGSVIPQSLVDEALGIDRPETGTQRQFQQIELLELGAIGELRSALLKQGKYIEGTRSGYRILLPSENAAVVDSLLESAQRKQARARMLMNTTPKQPGQEVSQRTARMLMQSHTAERTRKRNGGKPALQAA